jgi:hypothetical protein
MAKSHDRQIPKETNSLIGEDFYFIAANLKPVPRPEIVATPEPEPDQVPQQVESLTFTTYSLRKTPVEVSTIKQAILKFGLVDENWRPKKYIDNVFVDNGDDTITDKATGLMWQK